MQILRDCSRGKILNFTRVSIPLARYLAALKNIELLNFSQFVIAFVQNADMLFFYAAVKYVIIVF